MTDNSALAPEIQTDKVKTKTIPCTICRRPLIVNTFYAPAKGRCSEHKATPSAFVAQVTTATAGEIAKAAAPAAPATPNRALQNCRCPFCHEAMVIIRVNDKMGFFTFKCNQCKTAVEIMPAWAPMLIKSVPAHLKAVVDQFNTEAMERGAGFVHEEGYLKQGQGYEA